MGGWKQYPSKHIPKSPPTDFSCNTSEEDNPENLVHNWFWHLFDIIIIIKISLASAVMWTVGYGVYVDGPGSDGDLKHIFTYGFTKDPPNPHMAAPLLIVLVGMGLVYAIYPGIAPGMIVPFYLIDKIEMVLLLATFFPPIIVATLQLVIPEYSPKTKFAGDGMGGWKSYEAFGSNYDTTFYHSFDIMIVIKISLAVIFVYSLRCRESHIVVLLRDIKSIIITGITTNSETTETTTTPITGGTVKIITGPVKGKCEATDAPQPFAEDATPTPLGNVTNVKITPDKDGKATLTIDIKITADAATTDTALDALADLATPTGPCNVKVSGNTITITIKYEHKTKGCIKTEITLNGTGIASLEKLGLQTGTNTAKTVRVDPPPNHLTIKYDTTTGTKNISGPVAPPKDKTGKTMTDITKEIADGIGATATGAENYYSVTDPTSKIRYYFKLKDQLDTDAAITDAPGTIIVQYGHIFAEGFGDITDANPSMISPLLIVLVGMGLVYGICLNTQKDVITFEKNTKVKASGNLNPADLTAANSITKITITGTDGKTIATYNRDPEATPANTPGTLGLTISKDGEATATTFTKQEAPAPAGPGTKPGTITLKTTDSKTITITGKTTPATVHFGHIFTEKFDMSTVRPEIISPTLIVIVGIMKSQGIYDPYVFMGNWGGSHGPVTADGDLTLTPSDSGSYDTSSGNTITLTITSATYTNKRNSADLVLSTSGNSNTLQLTSNGNIATGGGTHTLTRKPSGLTLTLQTADSNVTNALTGTYNVILKITKDITLTDTLGSAGITLKKADVSLGTYSISNSGGDTTITGEPDKHDNHKTTKCCMYGKQNTWTTEDPNNRYGWHSFIISIPIKNFLPSILYIQFTIQNHIATDASPECTITYDAAKNKLTIKYTTTDGTEKEKTASLTNTSGTRIGNTSYYQYTATDNTSKITYTFITTTATLATGTTTDTVTIEYGHIFAERFGNLEVKASEHKAEGSSPEVCDPSESDNLVHAWFWHFFVILIVLKILLPSILYIHLTPAILWTLAYGYYRDTKITDAITGYTANPSIKTIKYGTKDVCTTTATSPTLITPNDTGATLTITNIKHTTI